MKKRILIVCIILVLTLTCLCLFSCKGTSEKKLADAFHTFNKAIREQHYKTRINVLVMRGDTVLTANFVLTKIGVTTNITYAVDKLNEFSVSDESIYAPSKYAERIEGTAVFNGSAIESIDGKELDSQVLLDIAEMSVMFRVSDFKDVTLDKNSFKGTVTAPKSFMNNEKFDGKDMTVSVEYARKDIKGMTIDYTDAKGATVKLEYIFSK